MKKISPHLILVKLKEQKEADAKAQQNQDGSGQSLLRQPMPGETSYGMSDQEKKLSPAGREIMKRRARYIEKQASTPVAPSAGSKRQLEPGVAESKVK